MLTSHEYHYFYKSPLSQWHKVDFYVEGIKYFCAEQYMMAKKSLLFDDINSYIKIMESDSPKEIQELGRKIKFFDQKVWDSCKEEIVYNGNYARFKQNKDQYDLLMETGNKILVEATDFDPIWSCGLSINDKRILDCKNWPGKNLLGKILTEVKYDLKKENKEF